MDGNIKRIFSGAFSVVAEECVCSGNGSSIVPFAKLETAKWNISSATAPQLGERERQKSCQHWKKYIAGLVKTTGKYLTWLMTLKCSNWSTPLDPLDVVSVKVLRGKYINQNWIQKKMSTFALCYTVWKYIVLICCVFRDAACSVFKLVVS